MNTFPAITPEPPYFAVIFSSKRTGLEEGYAAMADRMVELAAQQPGFLGVESVRQADGSGITVSYWKNEESIRAWKAVTEHRQAQSQGKTDWYAEYHVRIAKVERAYSFSA